MFIKFTSMNFLINTADRKKNMIIEKINTAHIMMKAQNEFLIDFFLSNTVYVLLSTCNFLFILMFAIKKKLHDK